MTALKAVTREVSPSIGNCELTYLARQAIDLDRARTQHRQYEECLAGLGCEITRLAAEPRLPDSVFVEDTAVVLDELAVIARPGARSRRAETQAVAEILAGYRRISHIQLPGTLDGGDVLVAGKMVFVGISRRTNQGGFAQMRSLLTPFGYKVEGVPVVGALHLKSAVGLVAEDTLLINPKWAYAGQFEDMRLIEVAADEPNGANALLVGKVVVYPAHHPATRERLEARGISVRTVDMSELARAEGGVTCCSLIFPEGPG